MTVGDNTLHFAYDAGGTPMTITVNGTAYYYTVNLQGDITGIHAADGTQLVTYTYDAWGNPLTTTTTTDETLSAVATTLANVNPLRYRGYVYDAETGLYYILSRYYNPETGRWMCSDVIASTGQGIIGCNMFAYCGNNPVVRVDVGGCFWDTLFDVVSLVVSVVEVISDPTDVGAWVGLALDVVDVVIPFVGGLGEAARAVDAAAEVADMADDIHDAGKALDVVDNVHDSSKVLDTAEDIPVTPSTRPAGWSVGDDITNLTAKGNTPSWTTIRQRYWKNEALYHPDRYPDSLDRMRKGLAPIDPDGFSMELHHPYGRDGENIFIFVPLTRKSHHAIHYWG